MKTLIVYHSKHGQTEKISRRIAGLFESKQIAVDMYHVDSLDINMTLQEFDLIVLAAPVYVGSHSRKLGRFIKRHLEQMNKAKSAFVSVSMSAAGGQKQRGEAMACAKAFLEKTGWKPTAVQLFGGCLDYLKYNWFVRWIMKRIAKANDGNTDTSKNHEYTNWNEVDEFALKLATQLNSSAGEKSTHDNYEKEISVR